MNPLKDEIINQLKSPKNTLTDESFNVYRQQYPYDVDMYLMESYWHLKKHHLSQAKELLLLSQKYNAYDVDTYFLLGEWHYLAQDYCAALEYYAYAYTLNCYFQQNHRFYSDNLNNEMISKSHLMIENTMNSDNSEAYKTKIKLLNKKLENSFDLFASILQIPTKNYIGEIVYNSTGEFRFCGFANVLDSHTYGRYETKCLLDFKGELLKIQLEGTSYSSKTEGTVLVPIASKESMNEIHISLNDGCTLATQQIEKNQFNYYRIKDESQITSKFPMIIGEPIQLGHNPSRKKLVISFFVDGLSQKLLQEENIKQLMPNTYRFFSRGVICENFFTTSDWTYPSLASFVSGATIPNHMMFHPQVNKPLPMDQKILFEYLNDAGYYTAMINGDWRSSFTNGYTRGIDRNITQHASHLREGYIISDAIEHIDAFRETDQFLWLSYCDLHDIADEYDLCVPVQTQLDCTLRKKEEKSATSIKQYYSSQKRNAYIQALRIADIRFQALYNYLEQNYTEDEFVITLFGDHGQTYLLSPEEHHLARYHSNVAFMVRGSGYSGICKEYISAIDYPHILCKLANIPEAPKTPEGQLPKFFGGKCERSYTITETIHPNDPYEAAIHAKDHIFYLTSQNKLSDSGRLEPGGYETKLTKEDGTILDNPKLTEYYVNLTWNRLKYILQY